jgi:hypothetical protein
VFDRFLVSNVLRQTLHKHPNNLSETDPKPPQILASLFETLLQKRRTGKFSTKKVSPLFDWSLIGFSL